MSVTYNSLITDTPGVLMAQNTEIAAVLPTLIRQAQDEVIDRMDHDAFKARVPNNATVEIGQPVLDMSNVVPSPVLEVRALRVVIDGQPIPMEKRDIEMLNLTFGAGQTGQPRFYAEDYDTLVMRVFPSPDTTYTIEVTANLRPPTLAEGVQENVLTRRYGRMLEMAVLKHGARWMRNAADEARYESVLGQTIMETNTQIRRRRRDETGVLVADKSNVTGAPVGM